MKKFILVLILIFLVSCKPKISEDVAKQKAVDIVNERVKFTVIENNSKKVVNFASNTITGTELEEDEWIIYIHTQSNEKDATFSVVLDAYTGEFIRLNQIK